MSTARIERASAAPPSAGARVMCSAPGQTMPSREYQVLSARPYTLAAAASSRRTSAASRHPSAQIPARVAPVVRTPRSRTPLAASAITWRTLGRELPPPISSSVVRISAPRSRR